MGWVCFNACLSLLGQFQATRHLSLPEVLAILPFRLRCCLIAYFAVGVIFLTWQQGWEVVTSLYVVVQIVTTIGRGLILVRFLFLSFSCTAL